MMSQLRIIFLVTVAIGWLHLGAEQIATGTVTHFGSGYFYNSRGDVMTAKHVIEGCRPDSISVQPIGQDWIPGRLIATSRFNDLAAIATDRPSDRFGAIQVAPDSKLPIVPTDDVDVFAAAYSSPLENGLKVQRHWGQIQAWQNPNQPPFMYRMRMDAWHGASGAPVLDYAALVVGVIVAGSTAPMPDDPERLTSIGYGDKWIFVLNPNAIVQFVNEANLYISTWDQWVRRDPMFIIDHAARVTVLITCVE